MRFFLQNIAQSNPMKAILLVFIGLASWIISLTQQCDIAVIATLCLTAINSLLIALVFYKTGKTKFPSPFVASTYWLGMSALPLLHHCWQIQLFAFGAFAIAIIIAGVNYQKEAIEEAFLTTLICCFLSPARWLIIASIIVLWVVYIIKGWMTWRIWAAAFVALAIRVLVMIALHYFDCAPYLWCENIPQLPWQSWTFFVGLFTGVTISTLLPIRKPSIASGIIYLTYFFILVTAGIVYHTPLFG